MLTPEERRLLYLYCSDHPVAHCSACEMPYKMSELGCDLFGPRSDLCPACRRSLMDSIRSHVASCLVQRVQADELRDRAKATRQRAQVLRKESQQACDQAEILSAEAESVIDEGERIRRQRPGEGK